MPIPLDDAYPMRYAYPQAVWDKIVADATKPGGSHAAAAPSARLTDRTMRDMTERELREYAEIAAAEPTLSQRSAAMFGASPLHYGTSALALLSYHQLNQVVALTHTLKGEPLAAAALKTLEGEQARRASTPTSRSLV